MQENAIEMVETATGEWISKAEYERRRATPQPPATIEPKIEPKHSYVDEIPHLGSPIEFFAAFGTLLLFAWLFG